MGSAPSAHLRWVDIPGIVRDKGLGGAWPGRYVELDAGMSVAALRALADLPLKREDGDLLMPVPVAFGINLDDDGRVLNVVAFPIDAKTKKFKPMMAPRVRDRTVGISANFLVDTSDYVVGLYNGPLNKEPPKKDENRRRDKYAAFMKKWQDEFLPRALEMGVTSPAIDAVTAFFDRHDIDAPDPKLTAAFVGRPDKQAAVAAVGFLHHGEPVVADDAVLSVLETLAASDIASGDGVCTVTGRFGPIAKGYDSIKGVPGTLAKGAQIVSFNVRSAKPYGFEGNIGSSAPGSFPTLNNATGEIVRGSANVGPTGLMAMRQQTQALNYMLGDGRDKHRFRVGNTAYLVWGNQIAEDQIGHVLGKTEADPAIDPDAPKAPKRKLTVAELNEQVRIAKGVFDAPRSGEEHTRRPNVHLLGLTGSQGRVSIVHYQTVGASVIQDAIARWTEQLAWGAGRMWGEATSTGYPWKPSIRSFERVLIPVAPGAKATEAINGARSRLGEQLVTAAFEGGPVALDVQRKALHLLAHGEFPGNSGNATRLSLTGLLGAALLRQPQTNHTKESLMQDPLYVIGQSFALVEWLQGQIIRSQRREGGVPSIRKMKIFVAGAPSRGYARIEEAYTIALANRALHPADSYIAQKRMREIASGFDGEPPPTRSNDPALFYIGYHHEEARLWNEVIAPRIAAAKERKANGQQATGVEPPPTPDDNPEDAIAAFDPAELGGAVLPRPADPKPTPAARRAQRKAS